MPTHFFRDVFRRVARLVRDCAHVQIGGASFAEWLGLLFWGYEVVKAGCTTFLRTVRKQFYGRFEIRNADLSVENVWDEIFDGARVPCIKLRQREGRLRLTDDRHSLEARLFNIVGPDEFKWVFQLIFGTGWFATAVVGVHNQDWHFVLFSPVCLRQDCAHLKTIIYAYTSWPKSNFDRSSGL